MVWAVSMFCSLYVVLTDFLVLTLVTFLQGLPVPFTLVIASPTGIRA